jgi:hypothetical protein
LDHAGQGGDAGVVVVVVVVAGAAVVGAVVGVVADSESRNSRWRGAFL